MWLGIDFGTTNTSAAVYDGHRVEYIPLDPQNRSAHNLRSMIYIDSKQRVRLGVDAVQTFLREDTGRPVVLEDKFVGTIENTVAQQYRGPLDPDGPITIIYDVVVHEDVGIRGRLLQSIKTALRDASYQGTQIFNKYYTVEELITLILEHVKQKAELHLKQPIHQAVIGRPVTFSQDDEVDCIAEEKIRQAAKLAGFTGVAFVTEPVAAATFYAERAGNDKTLLVFDFGGGTLDLTILQIAATGQQHILASKGVLVGGDDLDTAIMRGKVAPYFGTTSPIDMNFDGRPVAFPEPMAEFLDQWQTIPVLTRPQYLPVIQRGVMYSSNRHAFEALETLATKNYGFALFQEIERAKCDLSQRMQAAVQMKMEEIDLRIEVSRAEFNTLISQEKSLVRAGIREVIAASGLEAEQIDVVVATGGSSSIPAFQALLKAEMPAAQIVVSDLFGSVTGGLAIHAHRLQAEA
ncbi:MAG: Hsp70 family protein [Caldilineaceae bacterium]|nr:Hsp70 family protein [Caldilineaceae bacterium]